VLGSDIELDVRTEKKDHLGGSPAGGAQPFFPKQLRNSMETLSTVTYGTQIKNPSLLVILNSFTNEKRKFCVENV
jgi:hypothetical protein